MKGIPPQDMAISQCLTRGSDLTCTTCWGDEVSGTVVVVGDGAPVAVLSKCAMSAHNKVEAIHFNSSRECNLAGVP